MIDFILFSKEGVVKTLEDQQRIDSILKDRKVNVWIDVFNPDENDVKFLEEKFKFHKLALEDVIHRNQRPKVEDYEDYIFMVFRPVDKHRPRTTQLDIFLGKDYLVTIRRKTMECIEKIQAEVEKGKNYLGRGCDFLLYEIVDELIDGYFPIMDVVEEKIDKLEERAIKKPSLEVIDRLHYLKNSVFLMRKLIVAHRGNLHILSRSESEFIQPKTIFFLRDVYDHCFRLNDMIDTYRELISSTREIYLSQISNKLNETLRTLTVVATIVMPLTLIAGIYGMNFQFMPELQWRYGYFVVLGLMLLIAVFMVIYFRRRGWI